LRINHRNKKIIVVDSTSFSILLTKRKKAILKMGYWWSYPVAVYPVYGPYDYNYYGPKYVYVTKNEQSMNWVNQATMLKNQGRVVETTQTVIPHMSNDDLLKYQNFIDKKAPATETTMNIKKLIVSTLANRHKEQAMRPSRGRRL